MAQRTVTPRSPVEIVDALIAEHTAGALRYDGVHQDVYTVSLSGPDRVRRMAALHAQYWISGWQLGHTATTGGARVGTHAQRGMGPTDELAGLVEVLGQPSTDDRLRLAVYTALEETGRTTAGLAGLVGVTRKTLTRALTLRAEPGTLTPEMATRIVDALPEETHAVYTRALTDIDTGTGRGMPVGLRRARLLLRAQQRGLLTYIAPDDPSEARRADTFTVEVGGDTVVVPSVAVGWWLTGLADAVDPDHATTPDL